MKNRKTLFLSVVLLSVFVAWTFLVRFVDVQHIGPLGSVVGFATLNRYFHCITGVNMWLYAVTDWLGLVPIFFAFGFAVLGLVQWIKRKHIFKVDRSILILGIFYATVMAVYAFFEVVTVNFRPVLIQGVLETSYPSSTTMLVMCVMPTAIRQFEERIESKIFKRCFNSVIVAFTVFMVIARLVSGVHWITDIIGGILISSALTMAYFWADKAFKDQKAG